MKNNVRATLILLLASLSVQSQKNFHVTYKRNSWPIPITYNGGSKTIVFPDYGLEYNDSVSFFHINKVTNQFLKENGKDAYHHHSVYFHRGSGICYSGELVGKPKKKKKYLI